MNLGVTHCGLLYNTYSKQLALLNELLIQTMYQIFYHTDIIFFNRFFIKFKSTSAHVSELVRSSILANFYQTQHYGSTYGYRYRVRGCWSRDRPHVEEKGVPADRPRKSQKIGRRGRISDDDA
jgi:hypothetical protein